MIDLDHFKNINDTAGHAIGDRVLVAVAELLSQSIRKIDLAGRFGGEEFAILLTDTDRGGCERVFIIAGLHEHPPIELLADASPVAVVPGTPPAQQSGLKPFPTLLAGQAPSQIPIHGAGLIAQADGWDSMADRARASEHHGLCLGLDATNFAEAQAAGNAVVPQVVEWIARKLRGTYV